MIKAFAIGVALAGALFIITGDIMRGVLVIILSCAIFAAEYVGRDE